MNKYFISVIGFATLVVLSGCDVLDSSKPSESEAKKIILRAYKNSIDSGELAIEDFKKTDGKAMDAMGMNIYEMDVAATFKYPKGLDCTKDSYNIGALCWAHHKETLPAGFSETTETKITFDKSEKGWHLMSNPFGGGIQMIHMRES
jgi:hypothetical protein